MLVLLLSLMAALLPFIVSYDDSRHQLLTLWVKVNGLTDQPKAPVFHEEEQHLIKLVGSKPPPQRQYNVKALGKSKLPPKCLITWSR